MLQALVEIRLAALDLEGARRATDELADVADVLNAPLLRAAAAHTRGAVLLAGGDAGTSLPMLRQAWTAWQDLDIPYESARVRVLIGLAYRAMGDTPAAEMEFDAARWVFQQLGATPDLARADALSRTPSAKGASVLSAREAEVLRLVAAGKSNRAIAVELRISERTVERHVSNIFNKLDVASRAAATAYAYRHQLI